MKEFQESKLEEVPLTTDPDTEKEIKSGKFHIEPNSKIIRYFDVNPSKLPNSKTSIIKQK